MSRLTNTQRAIARARRTANRAANDMKRTFSDESIVLERLARRARRASCELDVQALAAAAREVVRLMFDPLALDQLDLRAEGGAFCALDAR